jgi:serine/threonine protein kinase
MNGTFRRGETLGPYRIVDKIGEGGMAEVYLAEAVGPSGFRKRVALKVLLPQWRDNARLQRLLIEEARIGAQLQHRNLVQIHELGLADGVYFARLDYVDGRDLASLLVRGPPPLALALLIGEEVALALAYMHAASDSSERPLGLVHRDVSPSNILLSRWGEVRLGDFGIAKATLLADATQANVRKGKYAYMSPEQVAGEPLSANSDQFGFGATLAELVCGERLFDGATPLETMEQVRRAEVPDLAGIDDGVARILRRCLDREPSARYPNARELYQALARCRRAWPATSVDLACWVDEQLGQGESTPAPAASQETVAE